MSAPVGSDTPSPPKPGLEPEHGGSSASAHAHLSARDAAAGICPYLVSEGGAWRTVTPSRDHRCSAVEPPAPQPTEKQRRHCLSPDHEDCPLYRAAREARTTSLAAGIDPHVIEAADGRRRALARTAPVVLEPPRLVDQVTRLQFDRGAGQIALIGLMLVAFAVVGIARFSGGPAPAEPSASPSSVAIASPSPSPTPRPTPAVTPSVVPSAAGSPEPSFRTTYTVKKGDTLVGIANKYKTTAAKIRALNGMTDNNLKTGQVLKIP